MICERCFQSLDEGQHGQYLCPLEPRPANGVIADSIPGGLWIKHGLCNEDGSPKRYDSHSEIKRESIRRRMINRVEHVGERGSDKSKHTVRWV